MANPYRNEMAARIGGEEVTLRLCFAQMQAVEARAGMGLITLSEKIVDRDVALWADIIALGLEGAAGVAPDETRRKADAKRVQRAMEAEGAGHYMTIAQALVLRALAGPPKAKADTTEPESGEDAAEGNADGA